MKRVDEHCFYLHSGELLCSLEDLADALGRIPESEFLYHVPGYKNDFAKWVGDVLELPDLAKKLSKLSSQTEMLVAVAAQLRNEVEETMQQTANQETINQETTNEKNNAKDANVFDEAEVAKKEPPETVADASEKKPSGELSEEQKAKIFADTKKSFEAEPALVFKADSQDAAPFVGDQGTEFREKISEKFDAANKRMIEKMTFSTPESLLKQIEILNEQEKELRIEISAQRKAGFDLFIADMLLQRFRPLVELAKASEDPLDFAAVQYLLKQIREEIVDAQKNPGPNVKKEIEAML